MSKYDPDWHERYIVQARWTKELRNYCYKQTVVSNANRVLEVGCGTGVIIRELVQSFNTTVFGCDINIKSLQKAKGYAQSGCFSLADAHNLPFSSSIFDLTLCHFFLLWTKNPLVCLMEMKRVTRSGGTILALAEPDYGGRLDFPDEFELIGNLQTKSLIKQGANPFLGRQLSSLFHQVGLVSIESGILGAHWQENHDQREFESEWTTIRSDISNNLTIEEFNQFHNRDLEARKNGSRVLFVPTFYAYGWVP